MTAVEPKLHAQYPMRNKTVRVNDPDMCLTDYGTLIGCRLALEHPERVQAPIVQNGNAFEEGLPEFWDLQRSR